MSTVLEMRETVSRYLGDWNPGTTTSGGSATTFIDSALTIETEDHFIQSDAKRTLVLLPSGRDGLSSAETIRATALTETTGTVTIVPSGATIDTAVGYEVHRLFDPTEKDDAITKALATVWPIVFKRVVQDFTFVKNQQDYDISAAGIFDNSPRQIHRVSNDDTEQTRVMRGWKANFADVAASLHFYDTIFTIDTFRVFGHKIAVIGDLTEEQDALIVAVQAALWLVRREIPRARVEDRSFLDALETNLMEEEQRVNSKYRTKGFDTTVPLRVYRGGHSRNPFDR